MRRYCVYYQPHEGCTFIYHCTIYNSLLPPAVDALRDCLALSHFRNLARLYQNDFVNPAVKSPLID